MGYWTMNNTKCPQCDKDALTQAKRWEVFFDITCQECGEKLRPMIALFMLCIPIAIFSALLTLFMTGVGLGAIAISIFIGLKVISSVFPLEVVRE
jgi:hypothetical protein